MRPNIAAPLADHLERLGLVLPDAVERASPLVAKWGQNLPPLEALWIDALNRTGAITAFQATMLNCGRGAELRVGSYILLSDMPRLNGRPAFLARRFGQAGVWELIVIECHDPGRAERLAASSAALAEAGRRWLREHAWPAPDRAAPVVEVGAEGSRFFAAMPHTDGRSLAELMVGRGRFDGSLATVIARSLLLLAAELDEAGLTHEFLSLHEVRFTDRGGVIIVAPGLAGVCSSDASAREGGPHRSASVFGSDDPPSTEQAAATVRADSRTGERRRACGALLAQLIFGAVDRARPTWDSLSRGIPPELLAVIDDLLSSSSSASFRQLADRLPRSDESARLHAARCAYRSAAIQLQWLQLPTRPSRSPIDLRRLTRAALCVLAIGGLLAAGWWGARWRSSSPLPIPNPPYAASQVRGDVELSRLGSAGEPIAGATGTTGESGAVDAGREASLSAVSGRFTESPKTAGADGGKTDRTSSSATVGGSGPDRFSSMAWAAHRENDSREEGAAAGAGSGLRPAHFEEARRTVPWSQPADLIIDSVAPLSADGLRLRDGQRVRAAPGRRAVIQLPHIGWRPSADRVIFEQIDFVASRPLEPDSDDMPAMIVLDGRQAEFCGCTFDAAGRIAIVWRPTAGTSGNGLTLGRLMMVDCVVRNSLVVVHSEGEAAQVLEAANVLHWGGGAFWRIGGTTGAGEPLKLVMRQFTSREAGPLIEFARDPPAAVPLTIEAEAAVIALHARRPVLMLNGRRPDRVLDRLVWTGQGSILAGDSPFAMLTRQADEVVPLDDEAVAIAGLARGRAEFAGSLESGIEGQQLVSWQGPSSGEDPPGIVARRLPQPATWR